MKPAAHEPRRCIVLRGSAEDSATRAEALLARHQPAHVLWVSNRGRGSFTHVAPNRVKNHLGASYDAVVLDTHEGLYADVLGQCEGFIWGGGSLLLLAPPTRHQPVAQQATLAVFPFGPENVTHHFWQRFEEHLRMFSTPPLQEALVPPSRTALGNPDQSTLVQQLVATWQQASPCVVSVTADRGRGKSSALGMAIRSLLQNDKHQVALTAPHLRALDEVRRFAGDSPRLQVMETDDLLGSTKPFDVIVIDEAAQLSVPLLEQLALRFPVSHLAFSTTTRGYEGTGRGFVLRFLRWVQGQQRPYRAFELTQPIRYGLADPVERMVHSLLLLNAEPADSGFQPNGQAALRQEKETQAAPTQKIKTLCRQISRAELASQPSRLEQIFGLLIQAHYRTTPSDLHRLLDAPNLQVHVLEEEQDIIGVALVAQEGELPPALCDDISLGRQRLRGHALPETLAWHCAMPRAAELRFRRSVRIAIHPAYRRLGLASRLVEHVHDAYEVDFWGTLFGATPELIRFRRTLGYEIVRVGVSRGARTGEPSVAMLKPFRPIAQDFMHALRVNLARALPLQLDLLEAENPGLLSAGLKASLRNGLPAPAPLSAEEENRVVEHYLSSPQPFEVVAYALRPWAQKRQAAMACLDPGHRVLLEKRVLQLCSWRKASASANYARVPHAMRELRRAFQALWDEQTKTR